MAELSRAPHRHTTTTDAPRLVPKRPLTKPTSSFGGVDEKPSEARGTLMLVAPPPPSSKKAAAATAKKRSSKEQPDGDGSVVRPFNSRQEPSPFLDSAYMERRAKALSAMRQRDSA